MSLLLLPVQFWGTEWGLLHCQGAARTAPVWGSGQGELLAFPMCGAFGEQAQSGSFTSPEVGAGCEAREFLAGRLQACLKPAFYKQKMYFEHQHMNFSVFSFLTVCKFRNLQGSSSYWCFMLLWKGNCYLGPKAAMALAAQTCHCLLCGPSWLQRGSVGDGCAVNDCFYLAHTWSKSAAVLTFESGRVVGRKDVMVFETKIDVHLQGFFYNFLFRFALEVGTGCIYGLMRRSCLNSRMLFTGRNELLLVFFFFLFSYCGYSM